MAEIKKYLDLTVGLPKLVEEIKAADNKVLEAAKTYTDNAPFDAAGSAATAEANAKAHAETKVTELANGAVKDNTDAIAKLNGAATEEGSVAKAIADAKALIDADVDAVEAKADKNAEDIAAINDATNGILAQAKADAKTKADAVQENVNALAGKVGDVPEGSTVMDIITNIQESAYDDTAIRGLISDLDSSKADKTQVATDIETAVNAEKSARETAVAGVQSEVDALEQTHATDKAALEAAIALKADITALNAVSDVANAAVKQADYDVKVKALEDEDARIVGLVEAEATKAREEEGKLDARLVEVEAFFHLAEGEQLDTALDRLVEIQTYLETEGAAADKMVEDIAANKKAIEDHIATDHDFAAADATLKSELEGKINGKVAQGDFDAVEGRVDVVEGKVTTLEGEMDAVEGRATTLEGKMTAVEGAVATKVEQEAYNAKIAALEGADAGQVERIAALEAKFGEGEGNVEDMIADAVAAGVADAVGQAEAKDAEVLAAAKKYADDEDAKIESRVDALETASATHALASDLTALDGRVTTAEGEIDTLQSEMDAVEALAAANKAAHEANAAAIALKASQADLEAAVERIGANETAIATKAAQADLTALAERVTTNEALSADNKARLDAFVAISADEITALFA